MHVEMLTVGPFQSNTFIAACNDTSEAILVDAGDEPLKITRTITREAKVLTHAGACDFEDLVDAEDRHTAGEVLHRTRDAFMDDLTDPHRAVF